jgi:hypothetical protein
VTKFFSKIAGRIKKELRPMENKIGMVKFKIDLKLSLLFLNNKKREKITKTGDVAKLTRLWLSKRAVREKINKNLFLFELMNLVRK